MKGLDTLVISMSTNFNVYAYNDILGNCMLLILLFSTCMLLSLLFRAGCLALVLGSGHFEEMLETAPSH